MLYGLFVFPFSILAVSCLTNGRVLLFPTANRAEDKGRLKSNIEYTQLNRRRVNVMIKSHLIQSLVKFSFNLQINASHHTNNVT